MAPKGIGGWLIFVAIGMITIPLSYFSTAYLDFGFFNNPEFSEYKSAFIIEGLVSLIFGLCSLHVARLFFTKDSDLPKMIIYLFMGNAIWSVLDTMLVMAVFEMGLEQSDIVDTMRPILSALIWIQYFKKSVRVKNTFGIRPNRLGGYEKGNLYQQSDNLD